MAALSDYLESGLLNHIFRGQEFPKPSSIAIALTSGVPLDSDTGETIPELPSGIQKGNLFVSTNYSRVDLGNPENSGNAFWSAVGVDDVTPFQVYGTSRIGDSAGASGYFAPLYQNQFTAFTVDPVSVLEFEFDEFPGIILYGPKNVIQSGVSTNPGFTDYEGNGFIKNNNQVVFDTALEDWGWISGVAILDTSNYASGNLLMYSALSNPRYVYVGDNIKFDVRSLEINFQ